MQHLIVDMVLLEPAVKRAVAAFQPVVGITRLSQRINSIQSEPLPVDDQAEAAAAANLKSGLPARTHGSSTHASSWADVIGEAVAWCQRTWK